MVEKTAAEKTTTRTSTASASATPAAEAKVTASAAVDTDKPKKKKKKYSQGTRDAQKLERALSKAAGRVARAVSAGIETYNHESERSARKKKDGAMRDALVNASLGMGDAIQELSRAPRELADGIPSGLMWRQMRSMARVILPEDKN